MENILRSMKTFLFPPKISEKKSIHYVNPELLLNFLKKIIHYVNPELLLNFLKYRFLFCPIYLRQTFEKTGSVISRFNSQHKNSKLKELSDCSWFSYGDEQNIFHIAALYYKHTFYNSPQKEMSRRTQLTCNWERKQKELRVHYQILLQFMCRDTITESRTSPSFSQACVI